MPQAPRSVKQNLGPIEDIREGDLVFTRDESGQLSIRAVLRSFVRDAIPIVAVTVTAASGSQEALKTTAEHPFRVQGEAWVAAGDLSEGAIVELIGGFGVVECVRFTSDLATVYNFEVEGLHNYCVGASGVLVHNTGPCFRQPFTRGNFTHNMTEVMPPPGTGWEAHHIIPHRFQHLFPNRNLNDPQTNGAWVPEGVHRRKGGSITKEWEDWARANPRATAQDVLDFARKIEEKAGLWIVKP